MGGTLRLGPRYCVSSVTPTISNFPEYFASRLPKCLPRALSPLKTCSQKFGLPLPLAALQAYPVEESPVLPRFSSRSGRSIHR